ncbi:MAG: ABC transporter substrate-binding protein [Lachnospiraceae bacterium]|nr:ABC transporter substrate-binding protein [Lachnospiraceae bacterium]
MNRGKKVIAVYLLLLTGLLGLCGCSAPSSASGSRKGTEDIELIYEGSMELRYAENFSVDYYRGGYVLLTLKEGEKFLIVPEGEAVLEKTKEDAVVLRRPLNNLYLVASAAMNMVCELDALDTVTLSGQKADGWYIEEARQAMESGKLLYAGKYNKPDYELILSRNCSLAIENKMISHAPEVIEKLEGFGIPVMIDYSSYESHPMGRVEWIKFYGALLGKTEQAEKAFEKQAAVLEQVMAEETTGKSVAFFFITANGMVQVRTPSDYVPKMIELAGGRYIFEELGEKGESGSTMNIQMEEFYSTAKDADFLIYNSTIDGGIASLEELLEKSGLLGDFKAFREGNVWCTTNDMYQQSMSIGYLIEDIHNMLLGDETAEMKYLFRLE